MISYVIINYVNFYVITDFKLPNETFVVNHLTLKYATLLVFLNDLEVQREII